ncbi:MAG TPA: hypothetical protein VHN18_14460 [Micromonosporaceae bacterium]|nr:hypothetical protein [Micromonosporaceae bacterium]
MDGQWRRHDAWIFVSLVVANGAGRHRRSATTRRPEGVRLADVLSTANYLTRSIPDRAEIEAAVRRLAGAGLISVSDGWFRLTPAGEQLWRSRPRGGAASTVEVVHGVLTRGKYVPGSADWRLSEADHAAAVLEYARFTPPAPRRSPEDGPR